MSSAITFLVTSDEDDSAVEDAIIRVFSSDGATFVTQGTTDSDGEVTFDLDDDTYWIRGSKIGFAFASKRTITVDSEDATYGFEAQDLDTHPPATDVNLCRVSGTIVNGAGSPAPGVTFNFMMTGSPRVVGGRVMLPASLYITADDDGYVEFDLVRNGVYEVFVQGVEDTIYRAKAPDYSWVDIADLLWPFVETVEFSSTDVAVDVGETVEITPTVTLSSRLTLPYDLDDSDSAEDDVVDVEELVTFSVADDSIATVEFDGETLTVTGVSAGTTTLSATIVEGAIDDRQPSPTLDWETVTITVS